MDSDERDIYLYLKTWGKEYVGAKEICRRAATKKRFAKNPDWAKPILHIMVENGILERDEGGRYRIKPDTRKRGRGRWMSPDIAGILKNNGMEVENLVEENINIIEDPDQT